MRAISETKRCEKSDVLEGKNVKEFSVVAKQCRQTVTGKRFILLSSYCKDWGMTQPVKYLLFKHEDNPQSPLKKPGSGAHAVIPELASLLL